MENGKRQRRTWVELPVDLVDDLQRCAKRNGITVSELCYHWVAFAAWLAGHNRGHFLPQEHRARPGTLGGKVRGVRFIQGAEEQQRFKAAIEAAGSSVSAVLRAAAQAYVEADGDVVTMNWPPVLDIFLVA